MTNKSGQCIGLVKSSSFHLLSPRPCSLEDVMLEHAFIKRTCNPSAAAGWRVRFGGFTYCSKAFVCFYTEAATTFKYAEWKMFSLLTPRM